MFPEEKCERCKVEPGIIYNEDGELLCEDCHFEEQVEIMWRDPLESDYWL